ncbi:hypothetical protein F5X96DRAFT_320777 [Biscogniauxia mediterranea]|nr:hypothetical protein F5X96DRAFT_320777 [Biscogniauxia mediterranea]
MCVRCVRYVNLPAYLIGLKTLKDFSPQLSQSSMPCLVVPLRRRIKVSLVFAMNRKPPSLPSVFSHKTILLPETGNILDGLPRRRPWVLTTLDSILIGLPGVHRLQLSHWRERDKMSSRSLKYGHLWPLYSGLPSSGLLGLGAICHESCMTNNTYIENGRLYTLLCASCSVLFFYTQPYSGLLGGQFEDDFEFICKVCMYIRRSA